MHLCTTNLDQRTYKPHYGKLIDMAQNGGYTKLSTRGSGICK
jgi:hypothetical protein